MEKFNTNEIKRADVCLVNFGEKKGSLQADYRPAVIVQNDIGNKYSPTTIVIPLTTVIKNLNMPTHVVIQKGQGGLTDDSMCLCEQPTSINKSQLIKKYGTLNAYIMRKIDIACEKSLGITTVKEIDYSYIQKRTSQIDRLLDVLKYTISKDIIDVIGEQIEEIKSFCDKYNLDSSIYLSKYESKTKDNALRRVV